MSVQSDSTLSKAYGLIVAGELRHAKNLLTDELTLDLENRDLVTAIQCCTFWVDTFEGLEQKDSFEQGESLVTRWREFKQFLDKNESIVSELIYAIKKGVFTFALEQYNKAYEDRTPRIHAEVCRKIGLCYKKLGSYEEALNFLVEANNTMPGCANILAEMADCYDLCGQNKLAKVIFREAFFIDAEKVDIAFLDSPLVNNLIKKVKEVGKKDKKPFSLQELQEWIPVYGTLYGVFNVRRTLKSQEVGRLKQDIYAKENEMKNPANNLEILQPRLLNMYFWLIDHYDLSNDSGAKIHEVLLKIKILDSNIYSQYTGKR